MHARVWGEGELGGVRGEAVRENTSQDMSMPIYRNCPGVYMERWRKPQQILL